MGAGDGAVLDRVGVAVIGAEPAGGAAAGRVGTGGAVQAGTGARAQIDRVAKGGFLQRDRDQQGAAREVVAVGRLRARPELDIAGTGARIEPVDLGVAAVQRGRIGNTCHHDLFLLCLTWPSNQVIGRKPEHPHFGYSGTKLELFLGMARLHGVPRQPSAS